MSALEGVLVVGADGLLGRALCRRLRADGTHVVRSSRRQGAAAAGALPLDLAAQPESWPELPRVRAAVICAAVARLQDCADDAEGSARINVGGTIALAERLAARGVYTLFLSSDKVFDGLVPQRRRDDAPCPRTEYGRQKAAAERAILGLGRAGAVLRLAKVLSPELTLLQDWRRALGAGRPIEAFHDMWLAPVRDDVVARLAARLVAERRPGIFQASGDQDIAYLELALSLARALGVDRGLVRARAADPALVPPEARPRHSTLDSELEARLYGLGATGSRALCQEVAAALA